MTRQRLFLSEIEKASWALFRRVETATPEVHWSDLVQAGMSEDSAKNYLVRWCRSGWLERVKEGAKHHFRLTELGRSTGTPEPGDATDETTAFRSDQEAAAWTAFRDHATQAGSAHWSDLTAIDLPTTTAKNYVKRWFDLGLLQLVEIDDGRKKYAPTQSTLKAMPARQTPETNMWRSMRLLKQFSPRDVAVHSNAGGMVVSLERAATYCRHLTEAGYLKPRQTAIPGRREPRYALVNDTGPQPPQQVRMTGLLDPNTGDFIPERRRTMP